jgi:tryptophan synthase beta subunit
VTYVSVTDDEAVDAFGLLTRKEGIIPALETSHAIAHAARVAPTLPTDHTIVICCSGRGDKDIQSINDYLERRK